MSIFFDIKYNYIKKRRVIKMIKIRNKCKIYQYCFEAGKVSCNRKQITKSGFKTRNQAYT